MARDLEGIARDIQENAKDPKNIKNFRFGYEDPICYPLKEIDFQTLANLFTPTEEDSYWLTCGGYVITKKEAQVLKKYVDNNCVFDFENYEYFLTSGSISGWDQCYHAGYVGNGFPDALPKAIPYKGSPYWWELANGNLLVLDDVWQELHMFNATGEIHLGIFDGNTGEMIRKPMRGKKLILIEWDIYERIFLLANNSPVPQTISENTLILQTQDDEFIIYHNYNDSILAKSIQYSNELYRLLASYKELPGKNWQITILQQITHEHVIDGIICLLQNYNPDIKLKSYNMIVLVPNDSPITKEFYRDALVLKITGNDMILYYKDHGFMCEKTVKNAAYYIYFELILFDIISPSTWKIPYTQEIKNKELIIDIVSLCGCATWDAGRVYKGPATGKKLTFKLV